MQNTRPLRYLLFSLLFALVLVGILLHSYVALAICMVCGMILAIWGDFIETRPTRAFQQHNELHNRHGHHRDIEA
ncbi:hypothetical protein NZD89_19275 [Alicyclobacillus fastidiosus]|uniref:DUF2273 domain-containing protein n=1 Tax=Alicyclobacillus fastidiosus TaxID=392011 RepID=A0ABY6ZC45_9BACL|nr:hypothetical protein [Alicyclobacillus fastidiosus]WAH40459.1 hypothetical protein NZD89_19275 [Alicyclobacillus fastidiosus]GMA61862.1 hypothetical protein GCM10025859_23020 [Alicyclobacillus fastidiosus]